MKDLLAIKNINALIAMLLACLVMGFGIGCLATSTLGNDPLGVLYAGISNVSGLNIATVTALVNVVLAVLAYFIDKSKLSLATILSCFTMSYGVSLATSFSVNGLYLQILLVIVGIIFIGFGVAVGIKADTGLNAYDAFIMGIVDKTNKGYALIRMICDLFFIVVGYLLGGKVAIATLVCLLFTGKVAEGFSYILKKI